MPRYSTVADVWTDDTPCKRVPEGTECVDAAGTVHTGWLYAETETGMLGVHAEVPNPSYRFPWLVWKVYKAPLKVEG